MTGTLITYLGKGEHIGRLRLSPGIRCSVTTPLHLSHDACQKPDVCCSVLLPRTGVGHPDGFTLSQSYTAPLSGGRQRLAELVSTNHPSNRDGKLFIYAPHVDATDSPPHDRTTVTRVHGDGLPDRQLLILCAHAWVFLSVFFSVQCSTFFLTPFCP